MRAERSLLRGTRNSELAASSGGLGAERLTIMARGWESKSVEEQIEASASAKSESRTAPAHPESARKIANIKLARAQVARSLEAAENPRYREMLERALAELDANLSKLEK